MHHQGDRRTRNTHAQLALAALVALLVLCVPLAADDSFPWLDTLDSGADVKASGAKLIALPMDLHRLDRDDGTVGKIANIAVHGWNSSGYEWIHLLKTLDDTDSSTWFWRWDWNGCPGSTADALSERLSQAPFTQVDRIRVLGHSYGGVLVAKAAERWPGSTPMEAHAIAAPLAGVGDRCPYETPTTLPPAVTFHEWRTRHKLDGAFRAMPVDPQVVELPGSTVIRLPATYNGRRLGHNWSVSWVADTLVGHAPNP